MGSTLVTIFEISSILFSAACTLGLCELFTKRRLYQGTCQRNCTHCDAPGCGPIMACEVIQLFMCRCSISVLFWLVCICGENTFQVGDVCIFELVMMRDDVVFQSSHFQMPGISGCLIVLWWIIVGAHLFCYCSVFTEFSFLLLLDWSGSWMWFLLYLMPRRGQSWNSSIRPSTNMFGPSIFMKKIPQG